MNKFEKILLMGLIIIAVVGLIYLAIPKYQVDMVKLRVMGNKHGKYKKIKGGI
jgi:hypothetical protein